RKFFDLARINKAPIAVEAVRRMDELFAIERDINGKPPHERRRVRQEQSRPLVITLEAWLREQRAKLSARNEVAKAISYSLNRWAGLVRFLDDGRLCMSNNAAERALRGVATMRSLCTPLSSVCKHCKLILLSVATRAGCSRDRRGYPIVLQVRGSDLVRRATHNLLGGKKPLRDEPSNTVMRDLKSRCGFRHREPFTILLSGTVGANPVHSPQRTDAMRRPGLSLTGGHSHPVQRRRDVFVRPSGRH